MRRHLPDLFFGTAPKGLTTKAGRGGEGKGPTVCLASHSAAKYW